MNRILLLLLMICSVPALAQESGKKKKKEQRRERIDAIIRQEEEGVIKYTRQTVFGAKLTSDGYGGFLEIGRARSIRKALLFQLDITERKHQKEVKSDFNLFQVSPIIYGKINYFYPIKLGVQQQYLLGNKSNKNGVSITANVGGGLSLGLLRPYTIEVEDADRKITKVTYYSDSTQFFNTANYHNVGGLFAGWSNLQVVPGIYLKPALRFEFGMYNEMVNAIEVGVTAEYFTKPIEQMAFVDQKKFFFGGYVSFAFGRRK